jgi:adenosylmethionine-8-amino-7-oxononanoate aminotransferase
MGEYLNQKLDKLRKHPLVGDIRGKGLMRGIEFVQDKPSRKPFEKNLGFSSRVSAACLEKGMFIEYSSGCDRGQAGDTVMLGPPFIITEDQIDDAVQILEQVLDQDLLSSERQFLTF